MSYKLVQNMIGPTCNNIGLLRDLYKRSKNKTLRLFIKILIARWDRSIFDTMRTYDELFIIYSGQEKSTTFKIIPDRRMEHLYYLIIIKSPKKTIILNNVSLWITSSKNTENFYKELKKLKGHI